MQTRHLAQLALGAIVASLVVAWSAAGVATQGAPAPAQAPSAVPPGNGGNAENGKKLFSTIGCYQCHGFEGQGAPSLAGPRIAPNPIPFRQFVAYVRAPKGDMPPFSVKATSDRQLTDIYAYLQSRPRPAPVRDIPQLAP